MTDTFDIPSYHRNTFYAPGLALPESDPDLLSKFAAHLQVTEQQALSLLRVAVLTERLEERGFEIRPA